MLSAADLAVARSALLWVRRQVAARHEPTAALDATITAIDTALTSGNGSPEQPPSHTGFVDVTEAARLLDVSDRHVRNLAPHIGGIKHAGRWIIPRSSLPED
ncbi:helix-turn-helix domain-containing protein [Mycobacterium sp. Y57]|uniref:helix-turn-helix domain-containing protein n=1 Tax=Mycolicibacterium xanthum TaxID=2796469 RepID=UPI001C840CD2|nr:helix-turn-helix domain-containing protein [Mycolicibacterium xanthum]MBX7433478.1 helix-turn-helix domain-containing protein [Mycolicibacterium xanthum]